MNNASSYFLVNKAREMIPWKKVSAESMPVYNLDDAGATIKILNYVCTGKLTLFPTIIIFLSFGAGYLLLYGNKGYDSGYFQSDEIYYGIAGAVLLLLAVTLLLGLVVWLVLRVSFIVTPTKLKIVKTGLLRSSTLEFDILAVSLHYFRTHFIEGRSWLQLVVRENDQFYQVKYV